MSENTSTALATREQSFSVYDRMGDPMAAVEKMGKWFAQSGLLGIKSQDQGAVVALTCMLEHITPLEFARTYDIIEGKPTMKAAAMRAEFQRRGGAFTWHKMTPEECSATARHPRLCPEGMTLSITLKELVESGVALDKDRKVKTNYRRSPRQMLVARVSAELVRLIDPEINAGHYAPEELDDDRPPAVDVLPASPRPASAPQPTTEAPQATPPTPEPQAKPQAPGLSDRVKAVLAAFKSKGVTREQLEWFAGNHKDQIFAEHWRDPEFDRFTKAKKMIESSDLAQRASLVQRLFNPGPEDSSPLDAPAAPEPPADIDPADADPGEPPPDPEEQP